MKTIKKDNSTLKQKVSLRKKLISQMDSPVVLETNGGKGEIWERCYAHIQFGIAFEKDSKKSSFLAEQRPLWAIYECDCMVGIESGIQNLYKVNYFDLDPYGDPWQIMDAVFGNMRSKQKVLAIAVNDGLRLGLKMNIGWCYSSMQAMVKKYGNQEIFKNYLDICQEMIREKAKNVGYNLSLWAGYYCGSSQQMTHYAGIFELMS